MFRSLNAKIVAAFIGVLLVALSAALVVDCRQARHYEHENIDAEGLAAAQGCAAVVGSAYANGGGERFAPGSTSYDSCRELLRELCQANGMSYLYVYRIDAENGTAAYIIAAGASDAEDEAITRERPYGKAIEAGDAERAFAAEMQLGQHASIEYDNQFGRMLDWLVPVGDMGDGVVAGASYSVSQREKRGIESAAGTMAPIVVAFLALLGIEVLILRKGVFRPLRTIARRMRGFSAESTEPFEPLGITSRDEIGDIAEAFEGMAGAIDEYTSNIERMTAERVQSDVELDIARRIQLGMVPERAEIAGAGFTACGLARPACSVGGDFYDVMQLEGGRFALVVGDVSGKGVAAALFMAMVKTMLHDSLLAGAGPADALNQVNSRLVEANPENMFASAFACVLDSATGEARYANAGHMPPFVVGGDVRALDVSAGDLLGLFDDACATEATASLGLGEGLLVYTDGAIEATNADGAFLGAGRLAAGIRANAPYACAADLADAAAHVVDEFSEGSEQFDDLTVVALVRAALPDGGAAVSLELPSDAASFERIREAVFSTEADDTLKRKACLACEEAFANIVSHAQATRVSVEVEGDADRIRVTLADDGVPFDPTTAAPQDKDFADLDTGGMGVELIRQLASDLSYRRESGRNILGIEVA